MTPQALLRHDVEDRVYPAQQAALQTNRSKTNISGFLKNSVANDNH